MKELTKEEIEIALTALIATKALIHTGIANHNDRKLLPEIDRLIAKLK